MRAEERRGVERLADVGWEPGPVGHLPDVILQVGEQPSEHALRGLVGPVGREQVAGGREDEIVPPEMESVWHQTPVISNWALTPDPTEANGV